MAFTNLPGMFCTITCLTVVVIGAMFLNLYGSRSYPVVYHGPPVSRLLLQGETLPNSTEPQWRDYSVTNKTVSITNRSKDGQLLKSSSGVLSHLPKHIMINSLAVSVTDIQNKHTTATLPSSSPTRVSTFSANPSIHVVTMLKADVMTDSRLASNSKGQDKTTLGPQSHTGAREWSQQTVDTQMQQHVYSVIKTSLVNNGRTLPSTQQLPTVLTTDRNVLSTVRDDTVHETPIVFSRRGYVLAVNYYEQQSMGSRNMFLLQCWAQRLGMLVVKPFMKDSRLTTPLDEQVQRTMLRFEDSFNLTDWSQRSQVVNHAPLVEWSQFLSKAPRKVILVRFEHPSVALLKSRQKAGEGILHQPQGDRYKSGCTSKWPSKSDLAFLTSKRFQVVRNVCFNFFFGDELSVDEFHEHLLGDFAANEVSVIFETWRGLGSAQRILVKNACPGTSPIQEFISPSKTLLQDAKEYIRSYLSGGTYMAVMGRLEMSLVTIHKKVPVVPFCLEATLAQWKAFREETHLEKTFLSIDIGKYGSSKFRYHLAPELAEKFAEFINTIFDGSMARKEWEKTFETVSHFKDAGYIGLLQKVIVTRAKCILFVGGGAFQRHALHLYKQLHPNPEDQCIKVVKPCTSSAKFEV